MLQQIGGQLKAKVYYVLGAAKGTPKPFIPKPYKPINWDADFEKTQQMKAPTEIIPQ